MKIILEAFGRLRSEPMDVPEDTGHTFKLALTQLPTAIVGYEGGAIGEIPFLSTMCEFEYTGKSYAMGRPEDWPRIYVLKDIYKF